MRRFSIVLLSFLCASCGKNFDQQVFTLKKITPDAVTKVREYVKDGGREIIVSSSGGYTSSAMSIGEILINNDVTLLVKEQCSSACAEYVLPAASKIVLVDKPFVAMHQNEQIRYLESRSLADVTNREKKCMEVMAEWAKDLLKRTGSDHQHYRKTLARLDIKNISLSRTDADCPNIEFDFDPDIWVLTTPELKNYLKREIIIGELCSEIGDDCMMPLRKGSGQIKNVFINGSKKSLN